MGSHGIWRARKSTSSCSANSKCPFEQHFNDCSLKVSNINFLLTMSIDCQEIWLWELINWSPKRKCLDLLSNSLNSFFKEMYRDQFGEFVCGYWGVLRSCWKVVGVCTFIVWLKEECITTWSRLKLTIRFEIWLFSLFVLSVLACCYADNITLGLLGTLL